MAWSQSISVLSTSETELAETVWQGSGDKALLNPGTRVPFQPLGGLVMRMAGELLTLHPCARSEFALLITDFH